MRADRYTIRTNTPVIYRDFLLNFDRDPVTGDLITVQNEEAVKNEVEQLVRTIIGERFYSRLGSRVNSLLFENYGSSVDQSDLIQELTNTLKTYCPRIYDATIDVDEEDLDNNVIGVNVGFRIVNIQKEFDVKLLLKRVR